MTWNEFKEAVDKKLEELEVDDPDIGYIDVTSASLGMALEDGPLIVDINERIGDLEVS